MRNGSLDRGKPELAMGLDRRLDDKAVPGIKVKEERPREEELMAVEREKLLQNSYLGLAGHHLPPHAAPPHLSLIHI